jgi:mono/diheme cytochrome c family protein
LTAEAARPRVYVQAPGTIATVMREQAAIGLFVPGAGGTISRAGAIASLRHGKVENDVLGGVPSGKILVDVVSGLPHGGRAPFVLVELPPPGEHPNTKRYPIAIVGGGYHGILTSDSTRIRGLVSIADIPRTIVALQEGRSPPIESEPDADAASDLRKLDQRLTRVHDVRGWTLVVVVLTVLALSLFAPRAAVLGAAAAITASLLLSGIGVTRFWLVLAPMVTLTAGIALAASWRRRLVPLAVASFLTAFTVALAVDPELNSLGVLGARPDGGGRFYGIGNQLETLLLPPVIAAAAIAGPRWLIPLGALALLTIGWSQAGADGGGLLVYGTALAVLVLRLRQVPLTTKRLAIAAITVVAGAGAFVGLDAALGGSSHVTDAFGTGPGSLLGDLAHRLHLSWASATSTWYRVLIFLACLGALVWFGTMRPRRTTVDALLAALAVSLLVNDTPVDIIGLGALGCATLLLWESVDSRPMRRGVLTAACVLAVLALAGCGEEGVVRPLPDTVVGTVAAEAPGRAIFLSQGCGACHMYGPAGAAANGEIGPNLDNLPADAQRAGQPLEQFVRESIVDPDKYVEKGFPKGVMPKSYRALPPDDLGALVEFLTKPQG